MGKKNKRKRSAAPVREERDGHDGGADMEGLLDPALAEELGGGGGDLLVISSKARGMGHDKYAAAVNGNNKKRKLDARGRALEDDVGCL